VITSLPTRTADWTCINNQGTDNIYIHFPDHDTLMFIDVVNAGWIPIYNLNLSDDVIGYTGAPAIALDVRDHAVDPPRPRPQRPRPPLTATHRGNPAVLRHLDRDHTPVQVLHYLTRIPGVVQVSPTCLKGIRLSRAEGLLRISCAAMAARAAGLGFSGELACCRRRHGRGPVLRDQRR